MSLLTTEISTIFLSDKANAATGMTSHCLSLPSPAVADSLPTILAAMNTRKTSARKTSAPARLTNTDKFDQDADSPGNVDSGYATAVPTPERANPETIHDNLANAIVVPRKSLFPRKVTKLRQFEKAIPQSTQNRFDDLYELFGTSLYEYVTKKAVRFGPISIKLKSLGETEETARPWVVVQCDKAVSKRVRSFFNQPQVKQQFQPCDTQLGLPSLEVVVCERPPRPAASPDIIDVWSQCNGENGDEALTTCGKVIGVGETQNRRIATLGGLVRVILPDGNSMLYGMSAGHALASDEDRGEEKVDPYDPDEEEDGPEDYFLNEEEYELDLDSEADDVSVDTRDSSPAPSNLVQNERRNLSWSKIGQVLTNSCNLEGDSRNLDWALVEIDDPMFYRPNLLLASAEQKLSNEARPYDHYNIELTAVPPTTTSPAPDQPVVLANDLSGFKYGTLKRFSSYLAMAPGREFVKTHDLVFADDFRLSPGDSGSWVVDSKTYEVYGHVIASDGFGEAHVVPLQATLDHIKKQFSAEAVDLPSGSDIEHTLKSALETRGTDEASTPLIPISTRAYPDSDGDSLPPDSPWSPKLSETTQITHSSSFEDSRRSSGLLRTKSQEYISPLRERLAPVRMSKAVTSTYDHSGDLFPRLPNEDLRSLGSCVSSRPTIDHPAIPSPSSDLIPALRCLEFLPSSDRGLTMVEAPYIPPSPGLDLPDSGYASVISSTSTSPLRRLDPQELTKDYKQFDRSRLPPQQDNHVEGAIDSVERAVDDGERAVNSDKRKPRSPRKWQGNFVERVKGMKGFFAQKNSGHRKPYGGETSRAKDQDGDERPLQELQADT